MCYLLQKKKRPGPIAASELVESIHDKIATLPKGQWVTQSFNQNGLQATFAFEM